ncbi:MAG: hypothetical protein JWN92_640 [Candidatus Acidoferrum typicum]|nr:hypothetical protein [Candidatus Acidoferrum typicum]
MTPPGLEENQVKLKHTAHAVCTASGLQAKPHSKKTKAREGEPPGSPSRFWIEK